VTSGAKSAYGYNHDASLVWFVDRWFCLWNASPDREGAAPQFIMSSTSFDFVTWSAPIPCFAVSDYSDNPIAVGASTLQWQPGTMVIDGVLHALWTNEGSTDGKNGTYVSRLISPDSKWTNEKLGVTPATISGKTYEQGFVTGDLVELPSGRILCPIVFQSRSVDVTIPAGVTQNKFYSRAKLAGVIYSDDRGASWHQGGLTTIEGAEGCVWEPFISIRTNGRVRLFVRNLYSEQATTLMLYTTVSDDGGLTFGKLRSAGVETISSRGTVVNQNLALGPAVMILNDNAKRSKPSTKIDRRALALWTSDNGDVFVPGLAISDEANDNAPCYPTARIKDGKLYVAYSTTARSNGFPSEIKTVIVDPAPSYRLATQRANSTALLSPDITTTPYRAFSSSYIMRMATAEVVKNSSSTQASIAIFGRFDNAASCCLIDRRGTKDGSGFLITANNTISVGVFKDTALIQVNSNVPLPVGRDAYIGVSIDGKAGTAVVSVMDEGVFTSRTIDFGFSPAALNPKNKVFLGCAKVGSSFFSPKGVIRFIKLYGSFLSEPEHRHIYNQVAPAVGVNRWVGEMSVPQTMLVNYDAGNPNAGENNRAWLKSYESTGKQNGYIDQTKAGIIIRGCASLSLIDRDAGTYAFRYRPLSGQAGEIVIATVGDANRYVELVRSVDSSILVKSFAGSSNVVTLLGTSDYSEQSVNINMGEVRSIEHSNCREYKLDESLSTFAFVGKAYMSGYSSPANAISIKFV
jgi:hypothetical protein